jgi:hypothetical protein
MTRRVALAVALAFTTIVTFSLVVFGAQHVVTFSHGGQLPAVQVGDPSSLTVGATAHVHAILAASGYVATEIEAGG